MDIILNELIMLIIALIIVALWCFAGWVIYTYGLQGSSSKTVLKNKQLFNRSKETIEDSVTEKAKTDKLVSSKKGVHTTRTKPAVLASGSTLIPENLTSVLLPGGNSSEQCKDCSPVDDELSLDVGVCDNIATEADELDSENTDTGIAVSDLDARDDQSNSDTESSICEESETYLIFESKENENKLDPDTENTASLENESDVVCESNLSETRASESDTESGTSSRNQSSQGITAGSDETRRLKLLMKRKRYISQLHDLDEYADEIIRLYFSSSAFADEVSSKSASSSDLTATEYDLADNPLGALSLDRLLETSHSGIIDFGMKTESSLPWFDSTSDVTEASYCTAEVCTTGADISTDCAETGTAGVEGTYFSDSEPEPSPDVFVVRRRENAKRDVILAQGVYSEESRAACYVIRSSDTSSLGSSDDSGIGVEYSERALLQSQPTIFGTVADDQTPRDNSTKRGLPQTPKSGAKSCPYNGVDRSAHPPDWASTPDDDNSLVYEDGVLVSGSLQALVQHAVPTAIYYPDTAYLFAFLLSSRLFIKPHELLQRICDVGFTQQGLKGNDLSTINKEKLGRFVPHMVQLLGEWSETFPYDFRDERMMVGVRTMTHRCIALEPGLRRDVTQVLHNLLNKLTQLERYEEGLAKLPAPPPSDFITQPTDITEVCNSPLVMAQQLTHIELEKLSYIGPEEFVQAFAKDNLDACYKDLKKTSNLESYIQWFNRLSYLVATHACTHVKKKQRVRVIEWWIEVARECFNIGNFNSLMGIIAGLNMSIVSRLKKTWSKVQSAKFSVLEHQMDPSSNFSSYRSTLKAAMWRSAGAVDDRQKIVIPFFSLLVKDLYFLNEGCASRLHNGHINFDKFWQLAKQVTEFMAWKQVTCPFEKVADVINYLQTTNVLTETGLALASFECEGPENSYEKERYKNLKADTQQQHQQSA